ncbi:DNA-formamidopyrimidine glycosylase [Pisciglobus halotolerans]|uniref:Formamidopyrimidine-DNA glycosylase n=1 Tax=Pisciglobus halotolerans TaxID=745365 RepID=A0A1I3C9K7_9LACT|nr:DNA-formamidopyrimidine glycosylase [Pisciglobus halotolerans]SFH71157.1 DNA-(apurinic or apyrimidinic site) lyase [Pisciglobus halotolerans]
MPELPEVETTRKGLMQLVQGAKIKSVDVYWPRIIAGEKTEDDFSIALENETIHQIGRRGKFLLFYLDHWTLISHLRMEGKYEVVSSEEPLKVHSHVVFHLEDGRDLRYLDVRKFGRMALVPLNKENDYPGIQKLGPEPTKEKFDLNLFKTNLKKHKKAIKPLLLDQTLVTGLGNIYVDEALFEAKIHPLRAANQLSDEEIRSLHQAIISVLGRAVEAGGTTIRTYKNALGEAGKFQLALKVYGQTGEPCPTCGRPIKKMTVAQRGTHFCAYCQPE